MVVFLQVYPEEEQSHQADSWYIAGKVDSVYTTNIGSQINDCTIADGSPETAWIDDSPKGTLPTITLWFSGACPMITQVSIFNGNVYTKDCWEEYGRAKRIRLVYKGRSVAILELEDSRTFQQLKVDTLGYHDKNHDVWSLSFEIIEVSPGTRTDKVSISEIMFDGVDYL